MMAFERIRVLRHLFGGSPGQPPVGAGTQPTVQEEVELRSLLAALRAHELSDRALRELPLAVIDTETTGFDPRADAILSIGAVWIDPDGDGEPFHRYVRMPPDFAVPPHIEELTGITAEKLRQGLPLDLALQEFLQYVGERLLVAHHAGHDIRFLNAALRRAWGAELDHHVIDTGKIAMWLHNLPRYPTLDMLLSLYDVPAIGRHTADGDARMTAAVARRQLELLAAAQILTLGQLWECLLVLEHRQGLV